VQLNKSRSELSGGRCAGSAMQTKRIARSRVRRERKIPRNGGNIFGRKFAQSRAGTAGVPRRCCTLPRADNPSTYHSGGSGTAVPHLPIAAQWPALAAAALDPRHTYPKLVTWEFFSRASRGSAQFVWSASRFPRHLPPLNSDLLLWSCHKRALTPFSRDSAPAHFFPAASLQQQTHVAPNEGQRRIQMVLERCFFLF